MTRADGGEPWVWIEAVCGKCARPSDGQHARAARVHASTTARSVVKAARAAGWTTDAAGEWRCTDYTSTPEQEPSDGR